jgi:hypothetical protein
VLGVRWVRRLRSILNWGAELPSWPAALIVAVLTWQVGMSPPGPGLDASWNAGLAMALEGGLQFGREVVFSYGPLGFLQNQFIWFGDLAVLAFLFSATLYLAFGFALVWALRRTLPLLPSMLIAFLALGLLPLLDQPLLLAALAALALLEQERSPRFLYAFVVLAATYAAVEALVKLSTGPVIVIVFLLALIGARARTLLLAGFLAIFGVELLILWLATGQSLGAIPDFVSNTLQVVSGYSTAMLRDAEVPAWKVTAATIAAALITFALIAASARVRFRDDRARWFGVAVVAATAFILFKEGVVRTDAGHLSLYFSSACVLWIAIPWGRSRWPVLLAGIAVIAALGIPVRPTGMATNFDVAANVRYAGEQVGTLVDGSRREEISEDGRAYLQSIYVIDPRMLALMRDRTVAVEPWEIAAAWAYDLDWQPLPVFQNYSAYTSELDRLNADAVASPDGPQRILREYAPLVYPEFPTPNLDNRFAGWDPPEQARAVLCHFAPLLTDSRWQVLRRVADRCGRSRPLGSVEAGEGELVRVPDPGPDEVVYVRIDGAAVGGLEKLTTMFLHARIRRLVVDGGNSFRLVPETAGDGLMLRSDPSVVEDLGVFSPVPQVTRIAVEGGSGELRYDFYAMPVRTAPAPAARAARELSGAAKAP